MSSRKVKTLKKRMRRSTYKAWQSEEGPSLSMAALEAAAKAAGPLAESMVLYLKKEIKSAEKFYV